MLPAPGALAEANPALDAIGAPKEPAYLYADEIADVGAMRLRRPAALQSRRPGSGPLVVDEGVRYLWAIDAQGRVLVAPEAHDGRGVETSGHPLLTGGRPARLAGVLRVDHGVAIIDSDSGRFAYMDASLRPENLDAAVAWIRRVGIRTRDGKRASLSSRFVPPVTERAVRGPLDVRDRRIAEQVARFGGYRLLPRRGSEEMPVGLQSTAARLRWTRRARQRWRRPARRPAHEAHSTHLGRRAFRARH